MLNNLKNYMKKIKSFKTNNFNLLIIISYNKLDQMVNYNKKNIINLIFLNIFAIC